MFRIQDKYITSAVDDYWRNLQRDLLAEVEAPLVLCGDGRNDSPGYNAQYCTYSLMDASSNHILAMEVIDAREVDNKSVNMEKIGFVRAVDDVVSLCETPIAEIVTDQHSQIRALMSKYFSHRIFIIFG